MRISCSNNVWFSFAWIVALSLEMTVAAQAQTGILSMQPAEAATDQSSYAARILNRRGVREVDPNVYVYNAEFAQRFQMPQEWVSDELKGADAVAFRVVPGYKTCGWGGDPQACREDEVRCEMDLYFDHQRNPLPWDERVNPSDQNHYRSSAWFLASPENRLARPRTSLLGGLPLPRDPLTDPKTSKELGWQYFASMDGRGGHGWSAVVSYDRQIFASTSLVTLGVMCGYPMAVLVITSDGSKTPFDAKDPSVYKSILLPKDWRARVANATKQSEQRNREFFKEQGEKALRELKEVPVFKKSIVPVQ